ncbi:MAG: Crp/Fnr family transcriptional regulator, partial [Dehalococcoidia bacterium]|nr:Crp/Fnr family transcriptional regulator [Dehalococcoidia bacterium]
DRAQILKKSLIFSGLEEEEIAGLARLCVEKKIPAGESVFWEGDPPDWFYLLAVGKIKVVKHSSTGKDFVIAFFGPGEIFGEVAVFENRPYPASAQAVEDSVALGIKREDFLKFLGRRPEVALRIINVLGGRLRMASNRLRDLASERVEQRLARVLRMLSARLGKELPFTRQDIADMAGTTIETAIRFLSSLDERQITRSERGKIIILNAQKLKLLAEGPPPF